MLDGRGLAFPFVADAGVLVFLFNDSLGGAVDSPAVHLIIKL